MAAWVLLWLCLLPALAPAEEAVYGTASQASSLQKRNTSARVAALGGNGASLDAGADSLLSNPAALAQIGGVELGLHHQSWLAGINQEVGTAAGPLSGGAWGLGLGWVDYGSLDAVDETGEPQGSVTAQDYSVSGAWARAVGAGFSVGASLRYAQQSMAGEGSSQSFIDLGMHWKGSRWQAGVLFADVASSILGGDRGPSALRSELSGDLSSHPGLLRCLAGFSAEPGGLSRLQAGLESTFYDRMTLRAGYEARLGATLVNGLSNATFGMGFVLGPAVLDYAYLPYGDLGAGHRLSLNWRLSAPPSASSGQARVAEPKPVPVMAPPLPVIEAPKPPPTPQPVPVATEEVDPMEAGVRLRIKVTDETLADASQAEQAGHWDEALAIHKALLIRFPESPQVWRSLGDLHFRAGHRDEAVEAYDKALSFGLMNEELKDWLTKYRSQP